MTENIKQTKKELSRQKNHQLILDAAEVIFSKGGFEGASMSIIAKQAGVPKANVHYYFQNKANLYAMVLERIITQWNLGLENVKVEDDPAIALHNYIAQKVTLAITKPMQSRLFATEIIQGAPYLNDYISEQVRPWMKTKTEVIQAWIDHKKINPIDPTHLLFSIWATTQYYADFQTEILLILNKQEYEKTDITNITKTVSQLILGGLGLTSPSDISNLSTLEN